MIAQPDGDVSAALTSDIRQRLLVYAELLEKWQKRINLVGNSTVTDIWKRHFQDSLQLLPLAGTWSDWADLGSGAGFPGMVVAIAAMDPSRSVHLIELDKRKASFLREVSRETQAAVQIHAGRIEHVLPELVRDTHFDIVSARALASMKSLVAYSRPALEKGAVGLFLKGKGVSGELTELADEVSLDIAYVASRTDPDAKIAIVRWRAFPMNSG